MNALTNGTPRRWPRIATLDPFGVLAPAKDSMHAAGRQPEAGYGCVEWYLYEEEPRAAVYSPETPRSRVGRDAPPAVAQ